MTLGVDEFYLTSPFFQKEKVSVSVLVNFISKAHKLGYRIILEKTSKKDRVKLVFIPSEIALSGYDTPWVLDNIGEYVIGMIGRAVGCVVDKKYPKQRRSKPRKSKRKAKK